MTNVLIIFLKYPEPGKVKTRLARVIGNEKACEVYTRLAEGILKNISSKKPGRYDLSIFYAPADKGNEIRSWLKPVLNDDSETGIQYIPQEGDDLGERMSNAFHRVLRAKEYTKAYPCNAVIIGTDCPGIDIALIESAFGILHEKDVVIGPSEDGGYYLLGMSRFIPDLFKDIAWSTDRVFSQTIKRIQKNDLSCDLLKVLIDIDTPEDLYRHASSFYRSADLGRTI